MIIIQLTPQTITRQQFDQMVSMELNCGLEPYSPEMLHVSITDLTTLGCLDGEILAGFITIEPDSEYLAGSMYIVNLNVAGEYRRRGVGTNLIMAACDYVSRQTDSFIITLDVSKTNRPALELYRKLGFQAMDIPSRNGPNDLVMAATYHKT